MLQLLNSFHPIPHRLGDHRVVGLELEGQVARLRHGAGCDEPERPPGARHRLDGDGRPANDASEAPLADRLGPLADHLGVVALVLLVARQRLAALVVVEGDILDSSLGEKTSVTS